tara:strand:+ start:1254 stop:1454 length:201 start_codon:yes stop_codon:yes gene_type:complete
LSPKAIFLDFTNTALESILTLFIEFKLIELNELNNIESVFEFNNNLPEFKIICSPLYLSIAVGGEK